MRIIATFALLLFTAPMLGGCLVATAGAGYAVGDEVNEGDGEFDVLEDVRNDGNGKN